MREVSRQTYSQTQLKSSAPLQYLSKTIGKMQLLDSLAIRSRADSTEIISFPSISR